MKQFYIFTVKEFYHIFRDRWTTMMILALPILMIVLFGFGISTEIKNARFSVYDPTPDGKAVVAFVQVLGDAPAIQIRTGWRAR